MLLIISHVVFFSIGNILRHEQVGCGWTADGDMDVEDMIDSLVEANDILLERVVSHKHRF